MIVTVGLIVLLAVPIVAWVLFRWWPSQRRRPRRRPRGRSTAGGNRDSAGMQPATEG